MSLRPRWLAETRNAGTDPTEARSALDSLARMLVPAHADACFVDVPRRASELERIAAAVAAPLLATAQHAFGNDTLLGSMEQRDGAPRRDVLSTGRSTCLSGNGLADRLGGSDAERRLIAALRPAAALIVPLSVGGRTLGTMLLLRVREHATFSAEEARDAEDLALQAGLLLENATLRRSADAAQRARSEFFAIVSHELRTPLNIILGYTELMLSGIPQRLAPESAQQVERIRASARYLLQRVEEVLAYARLEGRRERMNLQPVPLQPLLAECVDLVEPLAAAKTLAIRIAHVPSIEIVTDATHLRQILLHLLTNAVRFTDQGSITVRADLEHDLVAISVTDTGRGMTEEQLAQAFDPFWQADPLATRTTNGTGLGLSLARRLAELLGGEISGSSVPGKGSTFVLHLPQRRTER